MSGGLPIQTPAYQCAHNLGIESLAWLNDGQLLAVGGQRQVIQLYDLRDASWNNESPISFYAHTEMVNGILPESNNNNNIFATFGRNASEQVKVWDVRLNKSLVSEITLPPSNRGNSRRCGSVNAVT